MKGLLSVRAGVRAQAAQAAAPFPPARCAAESLFRKLLQRAVCWAAVWPRAGASGGAGAIRMLRAVGPEHWPQDLACHPGAGAAPESELQQQQQQRGVPWPCSSYPSSATPGAWEQVTLLSPVAHLPWRGPGLRGGEEKPGQPRA